MVCIMVVILRNILSNKYQQANQVQQKEYSAKKKKKTITWEKFMLFATAIDEKLNFKKYVSIISKKGKNHLNPVCRIANVYIKKKIKCK